MQAGRCTISYGGTYCYTRPIDQGKNTTNLVFSTFALISKNIAGFLYVTWCFQIFCAFISLYKYIESGYYPYIGSFPTLNCPENLEFNNISLLTCLFGTSHIMKISKPGLEMFLSGIPRPFSPQIHNILAHLNSCTQIAKQPLLLDTQFQLVFKHFQIV